VKVTRASRLPQHPVRVPLQSWGPPERDPELWPRRGRL
jgi:hypothetical protein